jgi:hypothetical protein
VFWENLVVLSWWIDGGWGWGAYDDLRVPLAHLGVFVFCDALEGGVAGLDHVRLGLVDAGWVAGWDLPRW